MIKSIVEFICSLLPKSKKNHINNPIKKSSDFYAVIQTTKYLLYEDLKNLNDLKEKIFAVTQTIAPYRSSHNIVRLVKIIDVDLDSGCILMEMISPDVNLNGKLEQFKIQKPSDYNTHKNVTQIRGTVESFDCYIEENLLFCDLMN